MQDDGQPAAARISAASEILNRGYGKAQQHIDMKATVTIADEFEAFVRELIQPQLISALWSMVVSIYVLATNRKSWLVAPCSVTRADAADTATVVDTRLDTTSTEWSLWFHNGGRRWCFLCPIQREDGKEAAVSASFTCHLVHSISVVAKHTASPIAQAKRAESSTRFLRKLHAIWEQTRRQSVERWEVRSAKVIPKLNVLIHRLGWPVF
jgi:hypothetical protein